MGIETSTPLENTMMTRYLSTLALALAAAAFAPTTHAETVLVYKEGQRVNPADVARVLGAPNRSIRLLDAPAAPAVATVAAATAATAAATASIQPVAAQSNETAADEASALSLPVRFAFDSTEILPAARTQLDALAEGLKLLPADQSVTIEGHTDSAGSDAYNLTLSRERARAVRDYLVSHHGLDAARLKTVGYGEGRPIEGSDPAAAMNRRVQFRGG